MWNYEQNGWWWKVKAQECGEKGTGGENCWNWDGA